jgi:uncharacterized protein YndB with AHSA1/START domain
LSHSYEVTARSTAPPGEVFALLADAPGWNRWAGLSVSHAGWEREGDPPPGGAGAIRRMGRPPFYGREQIIEYDPPHHMAYTVLSGIPVRNYRADVQLIATATGGTAITWRATFEPKIPGTGALLGAMLHRLIGSYAGRAADEAGRRATGS